jgi:hypothetical protein
LATKSLIPSRRSRRNSSFVLMDTKPRQPPLFPAPFALEKHQ